MSECLKQLKNGMNTENPTFVMMLGMCPTLAVTTSAFNGIGMGLTTMSVLILSNALISMLRNVIPDIVRIPAYIVVAATCVTMIRLMLKAYLPGLNKSLGVYIPLIVVNCIILGRAEAFASVNKVIVSVFDGVGMGLGFTFGLTCIGIIREILGSGSVFGYTLIPEDYHINIISMAPGAFLVLAFLVAFRNRVRGKKRIETKKDNCRSEVNKEILCGKKCASCSGIICSGNYCRK